MKDASLIEDTRQFDLNVSISDIEKDEFTVVIPVLNEEEGISSVIEAVKREDYHNILLVDGYSTDDTVHIARKNSVRVVFQHGVGKTGAIKTAIEHVRTPYFVVMDGDCTYDPRDIKKFFPHILKNDEVIGVRSFGRENIPFMNRFGNLMINSTFNFLFGTSLIDVCSGMYALRTDFAKQLSLKTGGFDVEVEVAAQAASDGRITQVPISYNTRVGQQKLRPWRDGLQILFTVWNLARSYNPVFLFSAVAALASIPAFIILFWVAVEWLQGIWHNGLALFGVMLIIIALLAFTVSTISMLLKRMEQKITIKLKKYYK